MPVPLIASHAHSTIRKASSVPARASPCLVSPRSKLVGPYRKSIPDTLPAYRSQTARRPGEAAYHTSVPAV
eukprot:587674-Rhodomonas_salina.3